MPMYRLLPNVGKHRTGGKSYRAGETLPLTEREAESIRHKLESTPVSKSVESKPTPPPVPSSSNVTPVPKGVRMEKEGETNTYNIIDTDTGKRVNENPLSYDEAVSEVQRLRNLAEKG